MLPGHKKLRGAPPHAQSAVLIFPGTPTCQHRVDERHMMRQLDERRDRRACAEAHLVVDGGQLGASLPSSSASKLSMRAASASAAARPSWHERRFASGEAASAAAALSCSSLALAPTAASCAPSPSTRPLSRALPCRMQAVQQPLPWQPLPWQPAPVAARRSARRAPRARRSPCR